MRTCVSCGDPIPDKKRKDAKYCDKAACRGREYRKRQADVAATRTASHEHQASTVLSCPCGRQYLMQVSELAPREPHTAPQLSSPDSAAEALTQTVLPTEPDICEPELQSKTDATDRQTLTQTVLPTDQGTAAASSGLERPANDAPAFTQTDRVTSPVNQPATDLVTLELYFTNGAERRIPFSQAVHRQSDGRWALHAHAQVAFSFGEPNHPCIGGRPGAWRKFYGERSPSEFGYDPDLVVMFWDQKGRRGRAASASVLLDILGDGWKEKLRKMCDVKV